MQESVNVLDSQQEIIIQVRKEIEKVIIGQKDVVDQLLLAVFAEGHALLEGVPGLGKTLLVRTLSQVLICHLIVYSLHQI